MRDVAETALYYSDCTYVPTSLWVDARICLAKQFVFEKNITQATQILREICFLIPPLPIDGLSFSTQQYSKKIGGLEGTNRINKDKNPNKPDQIQIMEEKVNQNLLKRKAVFNKMVDKFEEP